MEKGSQKPFEFNSALDKTFLKDLFEGDAHYAMIVFGDFLKDIPSYWNEVEEAYNSKNLNNLRSSIHKCKTLFGYVGHMQMLELFQNFEHKCGTVDKFDLMKDDYDLLQAKKKIAEQIIKNEYIRLTEYQSI